jgi:hypothetical protein
MYSPRTFTNQDVALNRRFMSDGAEHTKLLIKLRLISQVAWRPAYRLLSERRGLPTNALGRPIFRFQ